MFKWVQQKLGNTIGPILRTDLETVQHAWHKIDAEYSLMLDSDEGLDDPELLDKSEMKEHLKMMVGALLREDQEKPDSDSETGVCFEYVLQNNVVDRLCALGLPDRPPGMRRLVTRTLDLILSHLGKRLLPNMSVHLAVRQFVSICVDQGDLRTERRKRHFLSLLRTLCLILRDEPSLSGVFYEEKPIGFERPQFILFETLLSLMNDFDQDANAAIEGLLCCVQLPEDNVANYIVNHTDFVYQTVLGLLKLYEALDRDDDVKYGRKWNLVINRLRLIDVIVESSLPQISTSFCEEFRRRFLDQAIFPCLMSVQEAISCETTDRLSEMISEISCHDLLVTISEFLLGRTTSPTSTPPSEEMETNEHQMAHKLRTTLIKRINPLSSDVGFSTLGLFDTLLGLKIEPVYFNLIIDSLKRGYHLQSSVRVSQLSMLVPARIDEVAIASLFEGVIQSMGAEEKITYMLDAQTEASRWNEKYHTWLCSPDDEVLEDTFVNAKENEELNQLTSEASALLEEEFTEDEKKLSLGAVMADSAIKKAGPDADFKQSLFMETILRKLDQFYQNDFAENLRLTSVLARLLQCPHPILNSYLCNPKLEVKDGVKTLIPTLVKVYQDGLRRGESMPDFRKRLTAVRQSLNADGGSNVEADNKVFFSAFIVLEEFIKELLAVVHAQNQVQDYVRVALSKSASQLEAEQLDI